ncbi:DNA gyrase inhibitor YacG [Mycoplana sp. MJR14]|uniref:DNA gyrase inhibitor YacG n=1 Tax=Mycoplana sp. MJR14 TaxID=3032583 RepID=UPI000DD7C526|nr:DNA gyrase inhibitor YacG [Mycoplana sp. MJR14]MDF1631048.1 DNA gyrase inhibitor YacG [Mycoplana sp. MJR14]
MSGDMNKPKAKVEPLRKTRPCPECGRQSVREHYPFCSDRCRSLDLNRWLSGSYAIPVSDDEAKAGEND